MADEAPTQLPHLFLSDTAHTEPYTPPAAGGRPFRLPSRQRQQHGQRLLTHFDQLRQQAEEVFAEQNALGIDAGNGIYIQFESEPDFELKFESLEAIRSGIELLTVQQRDNITYATIFVPEGKMELLVRKISDYLDTSKDSEKGRPRNQKLVESVSSISHAMLTALWTDDPDTLPTEEETIWWEVWLRAGTDPSSFADFFREHAGQMDLLVSPEEIRFPDRTVLAVYGTKPQMSRSVKLLNCVAELRRAKECADFFTAMGAGEQYAWVHAALEDIEHAGQDAPSICILDTGINNAHPLLQPALDDGDMHTCHPLWLSTDHYGHGTEMAGLALYGDLTQQLAFAGPLRLTHRLESVKIKPPSGENPPHLYGDITAEAIARAETQAPGRQRITCMAVTATDSRDRGKPSSWSAAIDKLCAGNEEIGPRMIILSAGNTDPNFRHLFPDSNINDPGIHDPGQSWNGVTVGAYTEKNFIDPDQYPAWQTVAPPGDISPASTTSLTWQRPWPLKPDIVMEGGNMAIDPASGNADYVDSLGLLTTNWRFAIERPLTLTGDTSAATALAARMAAILQAMYPDSWPETIRALLIHSANWSESMLERFAPLRTRRQVENLLRYCGFGVPQMENAVWSAQNELTLIAQDSLQPFNRDGSRYTTKDLNIHRIPWPVDALQELGEVPVEMRVTLSYFIEPNPARRGWGRKYSYASHGLRFDVKRPLESLDNFRTRINRAAWDEETGNAGGAPQDPQWMLGPQLRKLGSIHSDIWKGTAAELSQRGYIAVYPVIGWWRENPRHRRWNSQARYSLVISIKAPEVDVELYTTIENMIQQPVAIEIS